MQPLIDSPEARYRRFLLLKREKQRRERRKVEQRSLVYYLKRIWPWFIVEEVHLLMAGYIESLVFGVIDRYMQFMAPRAGKSMVGSILAPTFFIGNFSSDKAMIASHEKDLAVDWGRQAKDIVQDEDYRAIFPKVMVRLDAKAAGRWYTTDRGGFYATGVTGGIAGRGWNFGSADDLLNEQTAMSDVENRRVINWWGPGFYTRRQPERSRIMLTMTRWRKDDIAGHLLDLHRRNPRADKYEVLKIPAIIDEVTAEMLNEVAGDPLLTPHSSGKRIRYRAGNSFAPRRWPLRELLRQRDNMTTRSWDALYLQNPTAEEGAIIKRAWWQPWKSSDGKPPPCLMVLQVYDTAFEEEELGVNRTGKRVKEEPDYSARTTWGIFEHQDRNGIVRPAMILLEAWHARIGFPELRLAAWQSYQAMKPDKVIIEKKASGHSLLQEMRRKRVPVVPVTIAKGNSKTVRANAASLVWEQSCVFYMTDTSGLVDERGKPMPRSDLLWAIEECTEFPFGDYDDGCDTCVHAALWVRKTMWVQLPGESEQEQELDEDAVEQAAQGERRLFG